jgi:C-terminal processing protease CtpA/Prc
MRRFQALLIAAGLAATPIGAAAGPSKDNNSNRPHTIERFEISMSKGRLGIMAMSLTPELRAHFGAAGDRGVIVARVEPGTPAEKAGLAVGDVIVDVRGDAIESAFDVTAALAPVKKGQDATIEVVRAGKPVSLTVTMTEDPQPRMDRKSMQWFRDFMKDPQNAPRWMDDWFDEHEPRESTKTKKT